MNTLASFHPAGLGVDGQVYIYDYFFDTGTIVAPGDLYSRSLADGRGYYIVAPIGQSGIAMLGDRGQFVTLGKKRVQALADDGTVHITIAFAAGETSRTIFGYAPMAPGVVSKTGSAGPVNYDPVSQRFTIDLMPGADGTAQVEISSGPIMP